MKTCENVIINVALRESIKEQEAFLKQQFIVSLQEEPPDDWFPDPKLPF